RYLSYIHSPARYLWSPDFDGRGSGWALAAPRKALRWLDVRLGSHVHSYAANSAEVRRRIERYWRRDARVIHPPVAVAYFAQPAPGAAASVPRLPVGRGSLHPLQELRPRHRDRGAGAASAGDRRIGTRTAPPARPGRSPRCGGQVRAEAGPVAPSRAVLGRA